MSILHINSSARLTGSNSRILGQYLIDSLNEPVISRDQVKQPLPSIDAEDLVAVHGSFDNQRSSLQLHLSASQQLIEELKRADTLVLGVAMHNFSIPVWLKQWVDLICRAGVSFKYTEQGPVGLLEVKRAIIITASGGTPIGSEVDFASRYLEHICRFIGIPEIYHIDASGSKRKPEEVIEQGKRQIDRLVSTFSENKILEAE